MRRGIVVYTTYRSLVVVESQLWYRLRYDYPTTTFARAFSIRREQKINMSISRRSLVVVVWSYRSRIVISITSVIVECVVVSSYRSRIIVESQ